MLLSQAFDIYAKNVIHYRNQSARTEENHFTALKSLIDFLGEDVELENLTFADVRKWRNHLETRRCVVGTIYGYIVRLRMVLDYAHNHGTKCLTKNEVPLPKRARNRAPSNLREDEISQLIIAASMTRGKMRSARNAAIVALMYSSGIRVGELVKLNRSDVYYDTFVASGKGEKDRPCFIDARARQHLNLYLKLRTDYCDALFVSDIRKKRITVGTVQEIFRNLRKRTGITGKVTPHATRHSFATNFLRNNGNLRHLQVMLGHESLATTQMYTHVVDEDLRAAHLRFHTLDPPIQGVDRTQAFC